jgi:Fe-S cluster assembly protein SufD
MMESLRNREDGIFYQSQIARFRSGAADNGQAWTRPLRESAFSRFAELGLPTTRLEEWKYTNVAPIARIPFNAPAVKNPKISLERLAPSGLAWLAETRLVCVNGRFSPELSFVEKLPREIQAGSLKAALSEQRSLVEPHLGRTVDCNDHALVALNTALMEDGVFVRIPKGTIIEKAVHLVFIATGGGDPTVSYPRNLIVMEEDSQAKIIESYIGFDAGVYFTNAVTEIVVGDNAVLDHTKIERESRKAFHIGALQVRQGKNSSFFSHVVLTGGALVRNEIGSVFGGEGGDCTLDGLYVAGGDQHVDNRTRIDHAQPHCSSRELYKGILGGAARGVFNGKIIVHKDAAKTDARQTNNNLLLSKEASVDTKPQLEIYNNDVKCNHGSTIGQIDPQALFYLRSRGLEEADAQRLLTFAFASEVIGRVKVERLRLQLEEWLLERFQERREDSNDSF